MSGNVYQTVLQDIPIRRTLRACGAHKGHSFAVFAGEACKNSKTMQKMACAAGQNVGEKENGKSSVGQAFV